MVVAKIPVYQIRNVMQTCRLLWCAAEEGGGGSE